MIEIDCLVGGEKERKEEKKNLSMIHTPTHKERQTESVLARERGVLFLF